MAWSYGNIDWNGTGAMVQAIGSVAAILAAIAIDQRSNARLRHADKMAAKKDIEERAELTLAVWVQSGQILAYTENVWVSLSKASTAGAALKDYREWLAHMSEQLDLLRMVLERVSDPMLLLHAAHFIRAARPLSNSPAAVSRTSLAPLVRARVDAMRVAQRGLTDKAGVASQAAGFDGNEFMTPARASLTGIVATSR